MTNKFAECSGDLSKTKAVLRAKENEIKQLNKRNEGKLKSDELTEIVDLKQQNEEISKKLDTKLNECQSLQSKLEKLQEDLKSLEKELNDKNQTIKDLVNILKE